MNKAHSFSNTRWTKRSLCPCLYYIMQTVAPVSKSSWYVAGCRSKPRSLANAQMSRVRKTIRKNKKVNCKSCFNLFHEKCLVLANDIKPTTNNFICTQCRWAELPFYTQYDTSSCDLEQPSCAQNALNRPSTESQVSNEHLSCLIAKHKTPEVHAS